MYVPVHRLTAVVACFDADRPLADIFETLDGADVHHSAPEVNGDRGIPWDNRPDCLHVVDHGTHSEVTQAQMRAWGEDAKRQAHEDASPDPDVCGRCGDEPDVLCQSPDFEGKRCVACAQVDTDGASIEVL